MGFFSWKTSDTKESISNIHSNRGTFPVYVLCPDGKKIKEENYNGYGDFGGQDIYALLADWNLPKDAPERFGEDGKPLHDMDFRLTGIDMEFSGSPLEFPIKIVRNPDLEYDEVEASENCEYQGFFYNDND